MLSIQPAGDNGGDEKLGAIGVWSSIGHGEKVWPIVLQLEVLISEFLAVDGLSTSSVVSGEVTTLKHELGNDTVEDRVGITIAFFASAEGTEVLCGPWDNIIKEVEYDSSVVLFVIVRPRNVEIALRHCEDGMVMVLK